MGGLLVDLQPRITRMIALCFAHTKKAPTSHLGRWVKSARPYFFSSRTQKPYSFLLPTSRLSE